MSYRVRLFIDFWNFQLQWNDHMTPEKQCDWPRLPAKFTAEAQRRISMAGLEGALRLEETRVYASFNPGSEADAKLKGWLTNFLDRQVGFRVFVTERRDRPVKVYCRECGWNIGSCPNCSQPLVRSREKGVDTAIVTDLLSLAWEGAYDVGILVSSDADLVPCVGRVQEKGFKIINASWPGRGHDLARACWASFNITDVASDLVR